MAQQDELPAWAKKQPASRMAQAPLPQPGPVKASERLALKRARRPSLTDASMKRVRRELRKRYPPDYWAQQKHKLDVRQSFAAFVKAAWPILEPGTPLVWNWHIDVICEALEKVTRGEIKRLLINVPPGHMKSMLVSVLWPAWNWLENPAWRALFCTYVDRLSVRDADKCRELIRSEWYQSMIPKCWGQGYDEAWTIRRDRDNVTDYQTTLYGVHLATSIKGAGTGFRGDCIVIDDPMNVDEWPTDEMLNGIISWYDKRMSSRFNDQGAGAIVIIMQRLHDNDLAGHVLNQDELNKDNPAWLPYEHICLRSEYDPERPNKYDRRTQRKELLFPQRFNENVIERAKIQLGAQFAAQHDQDPVPQSGGIFPMVKFCFYYPATLKPEEIPQPHLEKDVDGNWCACKQGPLPLHFDIEALSLDCAFKDEEDNDYVALQKWARKASDCYLLTQRHGHFSFSRTVEELRQLTRESPAAFAKYVEDKANGTAVIDHLKSEILGLIPVEPKGGKTARAHAVEPLVRAQNVWLPHPAIYGTWVLMLLAELRSFPKGKHDDQVDAMTQVLIEIALMFVNLWRGMTKE